MSNIIFEWNGGGILHNQLVTRPNFVNQPETIFEGPSIIFPSVTCLFRSKQRWIALPCPGQALETGPHQQRHEGKQVAACSAVVQRSDALSLTSKGSKDICFNTLSALKWKDVMEGENRLKPGTQSYTVARTCTDGDAPWQTTLPGQRRGRGGR